MITRDRHLFYESASATFREVQQAIEKQEEYLEPFKEQIQRYHGKYYKGSGEEEVDDKVLENHAHDVISYVVPRNAFNNPAFKMKTRLGGAQAEVVKALGPALNRWSKDARLGEKSEAVLVDLCFNMGVMMVTQDPIPGADLMTGLDPDDDQRLEQPHAPSAVRIAQDLYFEDPLAKDRDSIRFYGHTQVRDLKQIELEASFHPEYGWDLHQLRQQDAHSTEAGMRMDHSLSGADRADVQFREVWVPEMELDAYPDGSPAPAEGWRAHGFNGVILTIGANAPGEGEGDIGWLRAPRPYYGPPTGPYQVFGTYLVPNHTKPLGQLSVVEEQARDLNKHASVMAKNAADFKRIILVKKTSNRILSIIKNTEHHHVAPIDGFDKSMVSEVDLGGINQHDLAYNAAARDRLNRASHMDDARRGQTDSGATATSVAEAGASSDLRMSWVEEKFARGIRGVAYKAAWYLFHDNRVAFPMGSEYAADLEEEPELGLDEHGIEVLMPTNPWYGGGWEPGQPPFSGLELEIEPMSMKRRDEAAWRASLLAVHHEVLQMTPMMLQIGPAYDWKSIINEIGEAHGHPGIADHYDVDALFKQQPTLDPRLMQPFMMSQAGGRTNRTLGGAQRSGASSGSGATQPSMDLGRMLGQGSPAVQGGAPVSGFGQGAGAFQGVA